MFISELDSLRSGVCTLLTIYTIYVYICVCTSAYFKSFYFIEMNSLCRLLKETLNTFSVFSFYRNRCVDR